MTWMRIRRRFWLSETRPKQQGAVSGGLLQPAALTGDSLEHPAQALRQSLILGIVRQPNLSDTL